MAKETKEKSLNLFDYDAENKEKPIKKSSKKTKKNNVKKNQSNQRRKNQVNNKSKEKDTKDERFDFDEEIIIGLKRIDEPKKEEKKKPKNKNKKNLNNNKEKQNIKKENNRPNPNKVNLKAKEKKMSPKQILAKKKRQAVFRLVKWTSLGLIIIGAIIFTIMSPIFNVKNIKVEGNSHLSEEQIISLSRIEIENNMFKYNKKEIIKNIKENAYIENAQVKRSIPDTIEIKITERKTSFMIKFANAYAYINNQGYILEISNKALEYPILTGFNTPVEELQEGKRLNKEDLKKLSDVLEIMESATSNEIASLITEINIENSDNYVLELKSKNKVVNLGDTSNLSTKMLWIQTFNKLEGSTKGEIMLNMNLNDDKNKPYFRRNIES